MQTSIDPRNGEVVASYESHTVGAVDLALTAAVEAQGRWRSIGLDDRASLLLEVARRLRSERSRHARLITLEMGKPIVEAEAEIDKCAWALEYYASNAATILANRRVDSSAHDSWVVYDPLGVVLAIMPWNYPYWQVFRFVAPALMAGNAAVLKHAANVAGCALAIQDILEVSGAPAGLLQSLIIDSADVAGLIADDRIAAVTLTGSTEVGALVASQAGAALKKQVLELGGSDPFIVLADADVPAAAAAAVKARYVNAGQSCVNAKRFLLEDSIADEFVGELVERVRLLKVGDPFDAETQLGPMARANLRDAVHDQVQRSVAEGAELLLGGSLVDGPGFYYSPTVLDRVLPTHAAFREETFGPVAAITRVADQDEAILRANETEFGLGAALWTEAQRGVELARRIDAGAVFVNSVVASDPRLPFGGVKRSGYGRELGAEGLREFMNVKTLSVG